MRGQRGEEIKYTQAFAAVIRKTGEGTKLIVKSPKWYRAQLEKFRDGEEVTLMVHNRRPKRTEAQNRYYWGAYLPLIAEATGESDTEKLHEAFKGRFLVEGEIELFGKKVIITKSTTDLSKQEFYEYMRAIENLTGVTPPPVENYWNPQESDLVDNTN